MIRNERSVTKENYFMKKFAILIFFLTFITASRALPDIRTYRLQQANSLFNRKQYEYAIRTYKQILLVSSDKNEKFICQKGIAESYDKLKNFEKAEKEYNILVKNYPTAPAISTIRLRLAELHQINNDPIKYTKIIEEMAEKDPFNPDLQQRLFRAYKKINILEEKISSFENELIRSPGKNHIRRLLVNFYLWQKRYIKAISTWEKNPYKDFYYFETLGNLYFESNRKNEAVSIWKNIFSQSPNKNTLKAVVSILNRKGLIDESLNCYLEARKRFGRPFIYHREIFEIYLLQALRVPAFEELRNFLNYSPNNLSLVISELYEIIKEVKSPDFMIEKTKSEISRNPDRGEFYRLLGEIYLGTNQPGLSIPYFEKAGELKKNKEIVLTQLGKKLIKKKFYSEAIKAFTKIKESPSFGPLANYQIALSFYNLGSYDSSLNILNNIINENMPQPYFSQAYALKSDIFFETHNLSQAKETLNILKKMPVKQETRFKSFFRSVEVEFLLGNFAEARNQFTTIANNNLYGHYSPFASFYLAEIYFLEDEFEKARSSFENFAKRFPGEPRANKTLLRLVLLNKNKGNVDELKILTGIIREKNCYKLPEAEKNINIFLGKYPDSKLSLYFLMELGEVYSLENKWPEALEIYAKIQKTDSFFYKQEATKQLASIYELNFKDNAKARAEYIKLLTDFPENPVIELIRKKIEELNE